MPYFLLQVWRCSHTGRVANFSALAQDEDYATLKQRVCAHAAEGLPGSPAGLACRGRRRHVQTCSCPPPPHLACSAWTTTVDTRETHGGRREMTARAGHGYRPREPRRGPRDHARGRGAARGADRATRLRPPEAAEKEASCYRRDGAAHNIYQLTAQSTDRPVSVTGRLVCPEWRFARSSRDLRRAAMLCGRVRRQCPPTCTTSCGNVARRSHTLCLGRTLGVRHGTAALGIYSCMS
jgi:hypothetical protein